MKPLIEITTVPIQIKMKTTNAEQEYARSTTEMEIHRDNGSLKIKARPIKVNIDTHEVRNPVSPPWPAIWSRAHRRASRTATRPLSPTPARASCC